VEPKTRLHDLLGLRVDKATDEHGRDAAVFSTLLRDSLASNTAFHPYGGTVSRPVQQLENGMNEGNFRRILLHVKGSKRFKELKGTLLVEVDKPAGAIVTVNDILKVSGKIFDLPGGGSLTVSEARRQASGQVHVQIQTSFPLRGINGIRIMNNVVQVRRQFGGEWETMGLKPSQVRLLDTRGRAFRLATINAKGFNFNGGGITQQMSLIFEPAEAKDGAAKLVCFGARTAVVEVPFVLKNVALPEK
jgi:hypothetical protein